MYYFYVAVFGAIGALLRYGASVIIHTELFPLSTLLVNVVGCFFLAFIVRRFAGMPRFSQAFVNGLGTGLIGSFTTFSTFSVETLRLIQSGAWLPAVFYILASLITGFAAAGAGYWLGGNWGNPKLQRVNKDGKGAGQNAH